MANKFTLKGRHIEVEYTIGANPGLAALTYKNGPVSKSFRPSEIQTDATALGSLVSVALVRTVDVGGERFAFFLPQIDVARGQTARFSTVVILTRFGGPDSLPKRPTTWESHVLEGTAQTVEVPL